jgi:eukaryotic-like serine/threonine-protein kinase
MSLTIGTHLAQYEIVAPIGSGGMGDVYRARDLRLGREVAIKVMAPHIASDPEMRQRFETEARAIASLSHPSILSIYELAIVEGMPVAVMELLEGQTLRERMKRGPIPWREAVEFTASIAEGLSAAHAKGVIHRDLKPENVMVGSFGEVLVMDWGVARVGTAPRGPAPVEPAAAADVASPAHRPETRAGSVVGTPGYMAPEQARGDFADERSDVFALGAILHFLLTREHPASPPSAPARAPAALAAISRRAMAADPADRYPSARELAAEVGRYLQGERVAAHRETIFQRAGRVAYRHRAWILLVLAYLIMRLLLLGLRGA